MICRAETVSTRGMINNRCAVGVDILRCRCYFHMASGISGGDSQTFWRLTAYFSARMCLSADFSTTDVVAPAQCASVSPSFTDFFSAGGGLFRPLLLEYIRFIFGPRAADPPTCHPLIGVFQDPVISWNTAARSRWSSAATHFLRLQLRGNRWRPIRFRFRSHCTRMRTTGRNGKRRS